MEIMNCNTKYKSKINTTRGWEFKSEKDTDCEDGLESKACVGMQWKVKLKVGMIWVAS